MGVGERHALGGEPIDVGRGDGGGRIEGLDVAVAEVIGENEDDIGRGGGSGSETDEERGD